MKPIHEFYEAFRSIDKIKIASIEASHLSPPQTVTMIACKLYNYQNQTAPKPSQISEVLEVKPASITPILNQLEEKGYIVREYSKKDRREVFIKLTTLGEEEFEHIHKTAMAHFAKLVDFVGADAVEQFIEFSKKVEAFYTDETLKIK